MKFQKVKIGLWVLIAGVTLGVRAADIEPPKVQLVDKFGVNMANGQVTHSMEIVSIGGAMGLSDTISVYANEFNFLGYRGFNHKYWATASDVAINNSPTIGLTPRHVMRVYGPNGSADFAYHVGGVLQDYGTATAGYTYVALGDTRNTLEAIGEELVWTTTDGTVLRYSRAPANPRPASFGGLLLSIVYPNGFTVTITSGGMSVNTNTGFQLKKLYVADTTACPSVYPPLPEPRTSSNSGWSLSNPTRVVGINAAVDRCAPTATADTALQNCQLSKTWPTAKFTWPACMPDILYRLDNHEIGVTNSKGLTTTYKLKRYDLAYETVQGGGVAEGYQLGAEYSPRLVSVSAPNNSAVPILSYDYKNLFTTFGNSEGSIDFRLQKSGVTMAAARGDFLGGPAATYDLARPIYMDSENVGGPNNGVNYVRVLGNVNGAVGAIDYAETEAGRIDFEHTPRNFPTNFNKHSAPDESYGYDPRGNLTGIDYYGSPGYYSVAAEYPADCTPTTRKTCNQATRMRDAKGNWTDYTYHEESGQVATITGPPNKRGVRAKTTLTYAKFGASYYGTDGAWIDGSQTANKQIWLKTEERSCIDSRTPGACEKGEVVTTYEYNHHNLLLTGVKVTSPDGVRRTCYAYDFYGNQIGVTTPNGAAGLTQCPGSGVTP